MAIKVNTHHKELPNQITDVSHALTFNTGFIMAAAFDRGTETKYSTSGAALATYGATILNASLGAITGTLADGTYIGQDKLIVMSEGSNGCTVTVAHHETSDPEIFQFLTVDMYVKLVWTGTEWATVSYSCNIL